MTPEDERLKAERLARHAFSKAAASLLRTGLGAESYFSTVSTLPEARGLDPEIVKHIATAVLYASSLHRTDYEVRKDRLREDRAINRELDVEEQPAHPPLAALTLAELFDRPAPVSLIDQWLPELGLVQIVGEPGSLKTFFALDASLSIASGQAEFFGYRILKPGAVLYIAAEGAGAFQFRIRAWCAEHDTDPRTIQFRVIPMPVNLRDESFQAELLAIVTEMRPVLIVVDTLSRCTPGAEENSARDMGEVVGFCAALQVPSSAAIAFIHHPTKSDPKGGGRGSGVIFGAIDTEIRIDTKNKDEIPRLITVTCEKQKDDLRPLPLQLAGHVVTVRDLTGREMAHESGRPLTSLVLRRTDRALLNADAHREVAADHDIDREVLQVMRDYPNVTSIKKLREHMNMSSEKAGAAVSRILLQKLAVEGKRGEPYTLTDAGTEMLEVPF